MNFFWFVCFGIICFPADAKLQIYSLGHHGDCSFGKIVDAGIGRVESYSANVTWVVTAHAHMVLALVSDAGEVLLLQHESPFSSSLFSPILQ